MYKSSQIQKLTKIDINIYLKEDDLVDSLVQTYIR